MNAQLRRLAALRAKRTPDDVHIIRTCRHCGTEVEGDPGRTPCDRHPPAPKPAGKVINIQRSYGQDAERARLH